MKRSLIFLSALLLLATACKEEHTFYNTAAKAGIVAESEYEVGVPITFSDNSVPTEGVAIESYLWEFGDEDKSTSTEKNPTFIYMKDGNYSVKLTVTDANKLRSTAQHNITVINPTKADFGLEKDEYYLGDEVKFIDKSTTKGTTTIVSYMWEFADADHSTSTERNPVFRYDKAGSYPVKLTITDSYGLKASITRSVSIQDPSMVISTLWTAKIGGAIKGGSSPALSPDGSTVYTLRSLAGEDFAALIAFNSSDGQIKWTLNISSAMSDKSATAQAKDLFSSPSVAPDGTIYVVARDLQSTTANRGVYVIAVNPDGKVKWSHKGGAAGTNLYAITPAIDAQGNCYVATRGKEIWKLTPEGNVTVFNTDLNDMTGGITMSKNGVVYAAGKGNVGLFAVNATSGAVQWSYNTDFGGATDAFTGALRSAQVTVAKDGTLYYVTDIAGGGGAVIAINATTGTAKWVYKTTGAIPDGGVVIGEDGTIYANGGTDPASGLIALNGDGFLKWKFATTANVQTSPLIDNRGYIHVVDATSNYYIVKQDGTLFASTKLGVSTISSLVMDSKGLVYATVLEGGVPTMFCISSKAAGFSSASEWPMRGQNPQRTGLQK